LIDAVSGYSEQLGSGGYEMIAATGACCPEYFAGFACMVEHFGGLSAVMGRNIVELGGGRELGPLLPSLTLKNLGANMTIVDENYPNSQGMFIKNPLHECLSVIPHKSLDGITAFCTLELGASDDQFYQNMMASLVKQFGDVGVEEEALRLQVKSIMGVQPGAEGERIIDRLLDTSNADPGSSDLRDHIEGSRESPEYLRSLYQQMHEKLKPEGIAVVLNRLDKKGVGDSDIPDLGFDLIAKGHDSRRGPDECVLRVLAPR